LPWLDLEPPIAVFKLLKLVQTLDSLTSGIVSKALKEKMKVQTLKTFVSSQIFNVFNDGSQEVHFTSLTKLISGENRSLF
jgi:hypothetical protein